MFCTCRSAINITSILLQVSIGYVMYCESHKICGYEVKHCALTSQVFIADVSRDVRVPNPSDAGVNLLTSARPNTKIPNSWNIVRDHTHRVIRQRHYVIAAKCRCHLIRASVTNASRLSAQKRNIFFARLRCKPIHQCALLYLHTDCLPCPGNRAIASTLIAFDKVFLASQKGRITALHVPVYIT